MVDYIGHEKIEKKGFPIDIINISMKDFSREYIYFDLSDLIFKDIN